MKKLLLLIAGLAMVIASHAQTTGGLKAGLNLTNFGGDGAEDSKSRPGFHIGGYMNIGLNEKLSFQPELLFSTAGAKTEEKGPDFSFESTAKLSYLSIPLSLQYSFGSFNIHAGPQLSFLMSAKYEFTDSYTDTNGTTTTESGEDDVKEYLKGVDLGLNFGAGYSFGKLGVTARYSLGMANISDEGESNLTNKTIQFSVMYKLFGQ